MKIRNQSLRDQLLPLFLIQEDAPKGLSALGACHPSEVTEAMQDVASVLW